MSLISGKKNPLSVSCRALLMNNISEHCLTQLTIRIRYTKDYDYIPNTEYEMRLVFGTPFPLCKQATGKGFGVREKGGGLKQTQHTGFGCANDGLPIKPLHTQRAFVRLKGEQIGYCMDRSSVRSLHFPFTLPGCSLFVSPSLSVCQTLTHSLSRS